MPDQYHHGVRVIEINEGTRTIHGGEGGFCVLFREP